ncbi:hypothetical protein GFM44_23475 [Rhizobium leguminosarum bv. viciae]|nr:hypothetical protein [Rhizobium leguminosarum bv. viciae]
MFARSFGLSALLLAGPTQAAVPVIDNAFKIGTVVVNQPDRDRANKLYYKTARLLAATKAFQLRRPEAADFLPEQDRDHLFAENMSESEFIQKASKTIDDEISGIKMGDLPAIKVGQYAFAGGMTFIAKKLDMPAVLSSAISGEANAGTNSILQSTFWQSPLEMPEARADVVMPIFDKAQRMARVDKEFAAAYNATLTKYEGWVSQDDAEKAPEWQNFNLHNQADSIGNQLTNVKFESKTFEDQMNQRITKVAEQTRSYQKSIQDMRDILLDDQRSQAAKEQATHEKLLEQRQIEADLQYAELGFSIYEALAVKAGASQQQVQTIRTAEQATEAIVKVLNDVNEHPEIVAGGYAALVMIGVDLIMVSNGSHQDPNAPILEGIRKLAEQIDDLKKEVISRFESLDVKLAAQFSQMRNLSEVLTQGQQNQSVELTRIRTAVQETQRESQDFLEAHFRHNDNVNTIKCLTLRPNEVDARRDCAVSGLVLALDTSNSDAYVAANFSGLYDASVTGTGDRAAQRFINHFNAAVPLFSSIHPQKVTIPNPLAYTHGAEMMVAMIEQSPSIRSAPYMKGWEDAINVGEQIQFFYRTAFAQPVGDHYRVSGELVLNELDRYTQAVKDYLDQIENATASLAFPWKSYIQALPEEVLPDPNHLPPLEHEGAHTRIERHSEARLVDPTRGVFPRLDEAQRHPFLDLPIGMCEGTSTKVHNESGDSYAGTRERQYLGTMFHTPETEVQNGRLKILDQSIMAYVPREALWLERIRPERYQISACASRFEAYLEEMNKDLFYQNKYVATITLDIDLEFRLKDVMGSVIVPVSGAHLGIQYVGRPQLFIDNQFNFVSSLWKGFKYQEIQLGPIAGQMGNYFMPIIEPQGQETEIWMQELLNGERQAFAGDFKSRLEVGNVRAAKDAAIEEFRKLRTLRLLKTGQMPEADAMLLLFEQKVHLTNPEDIEDIYISGGTGLRELSERQVFDIKRRVSALSGREFNDPVETPVDATLAKLKLLQSLANKNGGRAK